MNFVAKHVIYSTRFCNNRFDCRRYFNVNFVQDDFGQTTSNDRSYQRRLFPLIGDENYEPQLSYRGSNWDGIKFLLDRDYFSQSVTFASKSETFVSDEKPGIMVSLN